MVKMVNALYGNEMWVAEDRVEEYKAAGHKLAAKTHSKEKPAKETKSKTKK